MDILVGVVELSTQRKLGVCSPDIRPFAFLQACSRQKVALTNVPVSAGRPPVGKQLGVTKLLTSESRLLFKAGTLYEGATVITTEYDAAAAQAPLLPLLTVLVADATDASR
jgi:hypothetical protein